MNAVVQHLGGKLMGVRSQRGGVQRLPQNRPPIPIIAVSSDPAVLRHMSLLFVVEPVLMKQPANLGAFSNQVEQPILERGWAPVWP